MSLEQIFALVQKEINACDEFGDTAQMLAVREGHKDVVAALIDRGDDVNAQNQTNGTTALMVAVYRGDKDMAAFLIDKGADVNAQNHNGETAQMLAVREGHKDIVGILKQELTPERLVSFIRNMPRKEAVLV